VSVAIFDVLSGIVAGVAESLNRAGPTIGLGGLHHRGQVLGYALRQAELTSSSAEARIVGISGLAFLRSF
jgi:hypothetical protein